MATTCPTAAAISQLVGSQLQLAVGPQQASDQNGNPVTLLNCRYTPTGTAVTATGSYGIRFTMHLPPDVPSFTSLSASLADTEKTFKVQAGSTIAAGGSTIHLFLTPDLGPGTYATYLSAGTALSTCTVEVLGPNGYVMDIAASAQAATDYTGDLSEHTQCGWAEGATRLAMTA